jgi:hypothetical protein
VRHQYRDLVTLLLDFGADRNLKGDNGTPLEVCFFLPCSVTQ